MNKEKQKEHLFKKIDEIEIEIHTLNDKLRMLEGRKKYLLDKINKLDGYKEDTVHQQLFGI